MATRKRKTRKLRASRTHGWGRSGQHRDSGMQGGHGNAGWKRHRWSSVIRYGWEIGKKGFTPVRPYTDNPINVGELNLSIDRFLEQGQAKQVEKRIELDLGQLGYTKLLGDGRINRPVRVTVRKSSEKAIEKISHAGGEVILPKVDKETESSTAVEEKEDRKASRPMGQPQSTKSSRKG